MEDDFQQKSRTQVKKEVEALQKLGEKLGKLPIAQLKRMDLPEKLLAALIEGHSITSKIAGRRHRQYIGVLMRNLDPEPIRQALLLGAADLPIEPKKDSKIQEWVDRLLTGDPQIMEEFILACPGLERQRLRQLLRNIKKQQKNGKTSKSLNVLEQLIVNLRNTK